MATTELTQKYLKMRPVNSDPSRTAQARKRTLDRKARRAAKGWR